MGKLSRDTSREIEDMQIAILRKMTAQEKLAQVNQLSCDMRNLTLIGIQQDYPDESQAQHFWRLAVQLLGHELAAKVYGPFPE